MRMRAAAGSERSQGCSLSAMQFIRMSSYVVTLIHWTRCDISELSEDVNWVLS